MCALSVCLSLCQQPSGARRGGSSKGVGAGKEVALTSSNVWLSLLETPSWAAPPPFLSLSLKHVPSKPLSADTPQWNQAQICCQEGRHFLDLPR